MQKEALFYDKLENDRVQCRLCPYNCKINPGKFGLCGVRQNIEGILYTLNYGEISSLANDPIEKKPLYHFHPGSNVLSVGTLGCNMQCIHCQNWQISHVSFEKGQEDIERGTEFISAESLVKLALKYKSAGIAWTYNEPTIWFEYCLDGAKLAKRRGLYTVWVTNGYVNPEPLDMIGPYLDAFRVDIKGFNNDLYSRLAKIHDFTPILEAAKRAKKKWNMHVECITLVIPKWNDDDVQLRQIAGWIKENLGAETPWHVTRFQPYLDLSYLPPTAVSTLEKARQIGLDAGLKYVYIGNVTGHNGENTYCPKCQKVIIERVGYGVHTPKIKDGKCIYCGEPIPIIGAGK
jgi:pyruvate formate lyase activating enzyme